MTVSTPYGFPSTCSSIHLQFDLQLFGAEAHRPQHTQATGLGDGSRYIAAVGEGKDRILDLEDVAELRSHENFPLRWVLVEES